MRTLLALILSWLMPSTGKRRATTDGVPTEHPIARTADEPTQALGVVRPARSPRPPAYLRGEDVALIRPYLIAYERTHGIHYQEAAA